MKYKTTTILLLFTLAFYLQDRYAISYNDDWNYAFIVQNEYSNFQSAANDFMKRQPVQSLHDAIISQSIDYFKTNGRFIIHTIVQYFCGTKTIQQFVILNSCMFALFTLLVIKLVNKTLDTWNLLILLSAIWILLPHKGITFMGNITCSVDYLWSCTGTLFFIFIFQSLLLNRKTYTHPILLLIILYAFIAGSLQESFTIGVSGTLFLYLIWKRKEIDIKTAIVAISYIIGTMVCLISPANFRRFDDINGAGFHHNSILGLLSSPVFILFLFTFMSLIKKRVLIKNIQNNFLIIIPIIINLLFVLFVAYNGRHQLTAINVFCLIFCFRQWMEYNLYKKRLIFILSTTLLMMTIFSYYPILQARKSYYDTYMMILNRIPNSKSGIVSGKEFENNYQKIKKNHLLECNYIDAFSFQDWDFFERSLSIYLTKGENNKLVKEIRK